MKYVGIDAGSTACKVALLEDEKIVLEIEDRNNGDVLDALDRIFSKLSGEISGKVKIGVTGSSRYLVANHFGTNIVNSEVIAHSIAVTSRHDVGTLIEIGGQDAKYVTFKDGIINSFQLNTSCGAGTGAFIESQCRRLGIDLSSLDECVYNSTNDIQISGKCGVFIESAVISQQRIGTRKEDIVKAVCKALVTNYLNEFCKNTEVVGPVWMQGGVAKFKSIVDLFSESLNIKVNVDPDCNFMGAVGMAMLAANDANGNEVDIEKIGDSSRYVKENMICGGCNQNCSLIGYYLDNELRFKIGGRCGKYC